MPKLWTKNMPEAIYIRKGLMMFIVGFITVIGLFIFWGLHHGQSSQPKKQASKSDIQQMANSEDTTWIKTNPNQSLKPATPAPQKGTQPAQPTVSGAPAAAATAPDETLTKAMTAPITSNQLTPDAGSNIRANAANNTPPAPNPSLAAQQPLTSDQNMQAEKQAFLKINGQPNPDDYLSSTVQNPLSKYELQAGTIIPGVLITGINSDLPGQITGQVRANVYDSIAGKYLLVPQGAKLTGIYDSQVAYGQERVLIAWKRIIFPNGQSMDLQGMPGADVSGYAGFNDQVNNHYVRIFGSAILISILSAGAQLSQPQNQNNNPFINNNPTVNQTIAQALGTNLANTGTQLTQKNLNIQPTLVIRPGYEFNVSVTKDMVFPHAYAG